MNTTYAKAFSEVLYLLNSMEEDNKNKVSKRLIDLMEKNCDKEYFPQNIYLSDSNSLLTETKILLSLIYRNYFCDKETQLRKAKEDEEYLKERYNVEKIFENKNFPQIEKVEGKEENISEEKSLIKVSRFQSIINKIKQVFRKG